MGEAALITGGAKRIGKAVVLALAQKGFDIALHCRNSEKEALQLAKQVSRMDRECEIFVCDLLHPGAISGLMDAVFQRFPRLRVLIHNASIFERGAFLETDETLFDRQMGIHLRVPFFLVQTFAKVTKKGVVITLCDTKIVKPFVSHFAYALSKTALWDFTRMAAVALAPSIRVNAVAPGLILPSAESTTQDLLRMAKRVPLAKKGKVENVVSAVLFLLENEYITGECIFVDGGQHLV